MNSNFDDYSSIISKEYSDQYFRLQIIKTVKYKHMTEVAFEYFSEYYWLCCDIAKVLKCKFTSFNEFNFIVYMTS